MLKIRKKKDILNNNHTKGNLDNPYMNLNYNFENEEFNIDPEKAIRLELYEHEIADNTFIDDLEKLDIENDDREYSYRDKA